MGQRFLHAFWLLDCDLIFFPTLQVRFLNTNLALFLLLSSTCNLFMQWSHLFEFYRNPTVFLDKKSHLPFQFGRPFFKKKIFIIML